VTIERTWDKSGEIRLALPMKVRAEAMPDNPNKVAFFSGPVLLAGALGTEGLEDIDPHAKEHGQFDHVPSPAYPMIVAGDKMRLDYIQPAGEPGTFVVRQSVLRMPAGEAHDVTLLPFYKMHYQRYIVYWDLLGLQDWTRMKDQFEAEQAGIRAAEAGTIDHIVPGRMQDERDHDFAGERTHQGSFRNRPWRDARAGGWFSFTMKVLPDTPVRLICTYWGSDGPGRDFDILVDDRRIATERLNQNHPGQFFSAMYDIPRQLTEGKSKVTVKFKARSGRSAGGIYECRIVKGQ
jgi:hypothetical protein